MITAWILNDCGWGDPKEWCSPVPHRSEARLVVQSVLWRLQDKEDNHAAALGILSLNNSSFSSVSSLFFYSCSAAWLWRKEAHILTSFHTQKLPCLLSFSSNPTYVPLISFCIHGFLLRLFLVGRCNSIFWLEFLLVYFCAPAQDHSPPSPAATGLVLEKAWLLLAELALLCCQIISAMMALLLLFYCDFLRVLPKPKYTIPAETSQHWQQQDNYTPYRKYWWVNPRKRLVFQAVWSHITGSFWTFWSAVTEDDCVVCCLAGYSNFDVFFQSIAPLSLFSDCIFLVSCHLSRYRSHLSFSSCF